ncbi:DUF6063 family protein [Cytobacillus oceanisediminis]|uniref:DUF6063 family protein n=1 Tax=Cytobacillus oceanisediminis TaxID=665099 RepID=UPI003734F1FE
MTEKDIQEQAFALYAKLLDKGALGKNHEMAIQYIQNEKVKLCVHRLAKSQGTEVFESGQHIHLITLPEGSIFATSYSQAVSQGKQLEVIDWYIVSFIQMVFCWEIDNDFSHKMSIEREGVTYPQLEEMVSKLFSDWKKINEDNEGGFAEEFKIAVQRITDKWEKLQYQKPRARYSLNSRAGLIHKAMLIFKEGKLVHISETHKTANIVYPTDILYERLEYIFHNLDRYQLLKTLINDSLEDYKIAIRNQAMELELDEGEGTA